MNYAKTADELALMRQGGKRLREIRKKLLNELKVGTVPLQIDDLARRLISEAGGTPSFMTVGDYRWTTCINVNDMVVHGIPTETPLKAGDRVGLDIGLLYKGLHTDTSWSVEVKSQKSLRAGGLSEPEAKVKSEVERFLKVGEEALTKAISQAKPGNRVGQISQAIQETIESADYSVVRSLVGHGIGKKLHEAPQVPGVLTKAIARTPKLEAGMVIAIEVIYNLGKPEIVYKNSDGWTLVTADGSISGLFEQTVWISPQGPIVLT